MGIVNPIHLAFVALVALVVLGPKKFPDLARAVGHGVREFRQALSFASLNDPPPPIPTHNGMFTPEAQPTVAPPPGAVPLGETVATGFDPTATQGQPTVPPATGIAYTDVPVVPTYTPAPVGEVSPTPQPASEPEQPTAVG